MDIGSAIGENLHRDKGDLEGLCQTKLSALSKDTSRPCGMCIGLARVLRNAPFCKLLEERRGIATGQLHLIRYFARHARWLQDRFPDGKLRDVEGLVKTVSFKDLEATDWSLTPGGADC